MEAGANAGKRDLVMQMGGRGDRHRINAEREQAGDIRHCFAAQRAANEIRLFGVGIGDRYQLDGGELGQDPGMVAAHNTDANDAHTQCFVATVIVRIIIVRTNIRGLCHCLRVPRLTTKSPCLLASMAKIGWRPSHHGRPNTF
jgi:hypothetical protein